MSSKSQSASRGKVFQRKALALAIGGSIALAFAGGAFAQAVNGTIYGTVPVASGETIQITGGAGYNRTITVGPSGKYSVELPVGTYTVSLLQNGRVVQSRGDVNPVAAGAVVVDFTKTGVSETLSTINVTANAIPPIDVTTTNQVTTITAKELQQLPIQRNAESIALLAPGVTPGASMLGGSGGLGTPLLVFGGASVAENAYYLDGMNTTDALTGQGGISLPYGAIQQQQTFTTGYGAKYGRSIGGVINQIGKSGSNEWHFGAKATWAPYAWQADYVNSYWNNPLSTTAGQEQGDLQRYRQGQGNMETIYDAYVSGPIIKDKLFFFLGVEQDTQHSNTITATGQNQVLTNHLPKIYAKLNWNINDNNVFSLTGVQNTNKQWQNNYAFSYSTFQPGAFQSTGETLKNDFRVWVANYTSYLTDNLTLHAMFGKMHGEYYSQLPSFPGYDPSLPNVLSASNQNPAFVPPGGIANSNSLTNLNNPAHRDTVANYRVDLDYKWRNHDFQVGIDNITTWDENDGVTMSGPGYAWRYFFTTPNVPITGSNPSVPPYVGPPDSNPAGDTGYTAAQYIFLNSAGVRVAQRAAYIEDNWQITPNLLLNIGLRDDSFVNDNPSGQPYVRLTKPQWAPRIGFSWDVHGDSTLKVFGNAGRYYLALPAAVALREAGSSTYTQQYYTYTGVDSNGIPTGLTLLPQNPSTGVSANNEYGQSLNPQMVAAQNVKAEYSDNFVLGMQQLFDPLGVKLVFGANGVYQKMGRILDDWDDQQTMCKVGVEEGYPWLTPSQCLNYTLGSVLINPGATETIMVENPSGGLVPVSITSTQMGWQRGATRKYAAINLSLGHPWDGKWMAKVIYTWGHNWGNTEGPVDSAIGQGGSSVSITEQWDFAQLMENSYGDQFNDQSTQLKFYGAYAINPEWTVGANWSIASGHPKICLGYYGPNVPPNFEYDPLGYGNAYHWCGGVPVPPGSTGFTPWTHILDLSTTYTPAWADYKLSFTLQVFNVFNKQTPLQYNVSYGTTGAPDTSWLLVQGWEEPRFAQFSIAYNW